MQKGSLTANHQENCRPKCSATPCANCACLRAKTLDGVRIPPGNRLEPLQGDRHGRYSIRINDHWRICFVWEKGDVHEAEIVSYH